MTEQEHIIWKMARSGYGEMWENGLREWDYLPSNSIERALWFNIAKKMLEEIKGANNVTNII